MLQKYLQIISPQALFVLGPPNLGAINSSNSSPISKHRPTGCSNTWLAMASVARLIQTQVAMKSDRRKPIRPCIPAEATTQTHTSLLIGTTNQQKNVYMLSKAVDVLHM